MYFDEEISEEKEEEIIQSIAERIHGMGIDTLAVFLLETAKPVTRLGTGMGRVFVSPFLPIFGEALDVYGHKVMEIFEKRKNVERLIQKIEKMNEEGKSKK